MRVTAGSQRGVPLVSPKGEDTRPTLDKVKQAIFSMIISRIGEVGLSGATVLDLFAGSGAMGVEALSRGASSAVFVDNNSNAIAAIKSNLTKTKLDGQASVIHGDYRLASGRFSLIFLDPPYNKTGLMKDALNMILEKNMLIPGGLIVCEHTNSEKFEEFNIVVTKTYGKVAVTICTTGK